jgi:hypothetical protein
MIWSVKRNGDRTATRKKVFYFHFIIVCDPEMFSALGCGGVGVIPLGMGEVVG